MFKDVSEFFTQNRLLKVVNNTVVTLVPKTSQPEIVRDFRPISCCTVDYKMISKIIYAIIKGALDGIIGLSLHSCREGSYLIILSLAMRWLKAIKEGICPQGVWLKWTCRRPTTRLSGSL